MDQNQLLMIFSIITSFASFILALVAISNFLLVKKQLRITEKQLLLLRNEKIPILNILNIKYVQNRVIIKLENKTDNPAIDIHLRTCFTPLIPSQQDQPWKFLFKLKDNLTRNKNVTCYPVRAVTYIKDKKNKMLLGPKDIGEFSAEIGFFISYFPPTGKKFHIEINKEFGRAIMFDDLLKILKDNGIRYCNVDLTLKYYDLAKSYAEADFIFFYVLDIEKHKTLADVVKDGIPFNQRTIDKSEMMTLPEDMIREFKERRDFLDDSKFF